MPIQFTFIKIAPISLFKRAQRHNAIVFVALLLWAILNPAYSYAASNGMVVSEQHLASQVGADILRAGGNAVDAAVAVGYALAVVNPCCGNLGGGGFMTIHLAKGKNIFINFRERAPLAATPNMFLDDKKNVIPDKSTTGYLAVGVPGTVLGLDTALKKYGTLSRKQVIAPAIALATKGYILTPGDVRLLRTNTADFKEQPNIAAIFLKNDKPLAVGDRLIQKNLAATLQLIADKGPNVFYRGAISDAVVQASQKNGGILAKKDFAEYTVEEFSPVQCTYLNYSVLSSAPPSSGGTTLCEMLNLLEPYPLKSLGFHSAESTHYIVEAMRRAYYDRANQLGDPDFVNNPVERLTSKAYARQVRTKIPESQASPSTESMQTTHYSVIDRWGNAASVTVTLNNFFGAHVIAGDTGFFLNDVMDDFAVKPGVPNQFGLVEGKQNGILPGKRPLSSMTPTLVLKNNNVVMVVGSPGGPRIITATLLTLLNVLEYHMPLQAAVNATRFHHQWLPDVIEYEPDAFTTKTMAKLTAMGYHFKPHHPWGAVEAIYIDPTTKVITGANDKRRPAGKAIGY